MICLLLELVTVVLSTSHLCTLMYRVQGVPETMINRVYQPGINFIPGISVSDPHKKNADPDPDPGLQKNADPDPDPGKAKFDQNL